MLFWTYEDMCPVRAVPAASRISQEEVFKRWPQVSLQGVQVERNKSQISAVERQDTCLQSELCSYPSGADSSPQGTS